MKRHIPVQIEWHPNPAQAVPIYRQILEWMYGKMESGEWPAGTRLPSQREMARHFQVNRSTLNQALKPLLEAGVLQGRGSQGTVVASTAWSLRLPVQPDWNRYMTAGYFRANQEVVQAINTLEFDDRLVRLGTGELDPRLFPQDAFCQTMRDVADTITSLGCRAVGDAHPASGPGRLCPEAGADRGAVVHLDYVWRPAGAPAHIGWPSSRRGDSLRRGPDICQIAPGLSVCPSSPLRPAHGRPGPVSGSPGKALAPVFR